MLYLPDLRATDDCAATYSSCPILDIVDDGFFFGPTDSTSFVVYTDDLLLNDSIPAGSYTLTFSACDPRISVQANAAKTEITVSGLNPGTQYKFCYEIDMCWQCDRTQNCDTQTAEVQVMTLSANQVLCPGPVTCDPNDNLFDLGDFEAFMPLGNGYFEQLCGFELEEDQCDPLPQGSAYLDNGPGNTPGVRTDGTNQYAYLAGTISGLLPSSITRTNPESLIIPLASPINPGCTLNYSFAYRQDATSNANGIVEVYATTADPCTTSGDAYCDDPTILGDFICLTPTAITVNNATFATFSASWVNNTADPIHYLVIANNTLVYGQISTLKYQINIDDIVVQRDCDYALAVTPEVQEACADGQIIIDYELCLTGVNNDPQDITLDITLPAMPSLSFNNADAVNGDVGTYNIQGMVPNAPTCTTEQIIIDVGAGTPAGTLVDLTAAFIADNVCVDDVLTTVTLIPCIPPDLECPCLNAEAINIDAGAGTPIGNTVLAQFDSDPGPNTSVLLFVPCIAIEGRLLIGAQDVLGLIGGEIKMQEGAEIVVESNGLFGLFSVDEDIDGDNSFGIHGCNNLWRSISVEPGGALVARTSLVQDALFAFDFQTSSIMRGFSGNELDRNHIGLQMGRTVVQEPPFDNLFHCSASLLPMYSGQTEPSYSFAQSGIRLYQNIPLTLGPDNEFTELKVGIKVDEQSMVDVSSGNYFHDLLTSSEDPLIPERSIGIMLNDNSFARAHKQQNVRFENLDRGVDGEGLGSSDLDQCDFINVAEAAVLRLDLDQNFIFSNNTVQYQQEGLRVVNLSSRARGQTNGNAFTQLSTSTTLVPYAISLLGISEEPIDGGDIKINGNMLSLHTASGGIRIRNLYGAVISNNGLGFDFSTLSNPSRRYGIRVFNCLRTSVLENDMEADISTEPLTALSMLASDATVFCCNTVGGTQIGLSVEQQCLSSAIRFTSMTDHAIGLLYSGEMAQTGPQEKAGNEWHGIFTDVGAKHQGDLADITNSQFFVPLPVMPPLWPLTIEPMNGWFFDGDAPLDCEDENEFCSEFFPEPLAPDPDPDIKSFEVTTATGGQATGTYAGIRDWEARRSLYRRIFEQPTLLGQDPDVDQFYQEQQDSTLGKQTELGFALAGLYTDITTLPVIHDALASAYDEMQVLDSLYFVAQTLDSASYHQQRLPWLDSLDVQMNAYQVTLQELDSLRNIKVSQLDIWNDTIPTSALAADNRKTVNDIYLATLAQGITTLSSSEKTDLLAIANQCSSEGGQAVLRARTLYNMFEPTEFDDSACQSEALQQIPRQPEIIEQGHKPYLRPNPAHHRSELIIPKEGPQAISYTGWYLTDLNGKILLHNNEPLLPASRQRIDLQSLSRGLYLLRLLGEEPIILKIVVQ